MDEIRFWPFAGAPEHLHRNMNRLQEPLWLARIPTALLDDYELHEQARAWLVAPYVYHVYDEYERAEIWIGCAQPPLPAEGEEAEPAQVETAATFSASAAASSSAESALGEPGDYRPRTENSAVRLHVPELRDALREREAPRPSQIGRIAAIFIPRRARD